MAASGRIVEANERAAHLFGWSRSELLELDVESLVPARYRAAHRDLRASFQAAPEARALGVGRDLTAVRRDGSEVPVEISLVPVPADAGMLTLAIVIDISQQKRLERQRDARERELRHQALHDPLTGVANRSMLRQSLREATQAQRDAGAAAALLLFDLANFRQVNRTYGHKVGDALLRAVGDLLRAEAPDAVVARLGADQFAVLTGALAKGEADAVKLVDRLLEELKRLEFDGHRQLAGATAGIVMIGGAEGNPEAIVGFAEEAVLEAKRKGTERVVMHDRALQERVAATRQMEVALREALQTEELWTAYQPIVRLADCHVVGFEALARWTHGGADIPPGEFIPIAERAGLIDRLGARVLEEATLRAARWQQRAGRPDLAIAVNAAPPEIESDLYVEAVSSILDRTGLSPESLWLEITETALLHDVEVCSKRIEELQDVGVRVALDDFGTGYSSLSHWVDIQFDALKLDRSFIARITTDPRSAALVKALTVACPGMEATEIAEGVELEEQAELLREMGVELAQGYLFGRPEHPARAGALLNGGSRA